MSTDLELWSRAAGGSGEAFGALFDKYARDVYNHCFRRTADWSAAEDLTSVVFLEAWRRRGEVRIDRESALPWLLGVANNVLRNRHRSLRRGGRRPGRPGGHRAVAAFPGAEPPEGPPGEGTPATARTRMG
ncbi:RNA polymerase sigma factor [Nonomuraea wenchangensis]|uniref:RNA polymerase sigma factor n=1 Tax=Nonomuraea wenchangensis TaxID=568860 RepID=UPI003418E8EF